MIVKNEDTFSHSFFNHFLVLFFARSSNINYFSNQKKSSNSDYLLIVLPTWYFCECSPNVTIIGNALYRSACTSNIIWSSFVAASLKTKYVTSYMSTMKASLHPPPAQTVENSPCSSRSFLACRFENLLIKNGVLQQVYTKNWGHQIHHFDSHGSSQMD